MKYSIIHCLIPWWKNWILRAFNLSSIFLWTETQLMRCLIVLRGISLISFKNYKRLLVQQQDKTLISNRLLGQLNTDSVMVNWELSPMLKIFLEVLCGICCVSAFPSHFVFILCHYFFICLKSNVFPDSKSQRVKLVPVYQYCRKWVFSNIQYCLCIKSNQHFWKH